jgi:hypothetical protein
VALARGTATEDAVAALVEQALGAAGHTPLVLPGEVYHGVGWDPTRGTNPLTAEGAWDPWAPACLPAWQRVSLDGMAPSGVIFEFKSKIQAWWGGGPSAPPYYVLQCLHQAAVVGAPYVVLGQAYVHTPGWDPTWEATVKAKDPTASLHCLQLHTVRRSEESDAFFLQWSDVIGNAAANVAGLPYDTVAEGAACSVPFTACLGEEHERETLYCKLWMYLAHKKSTLGFTEAVQALCDSCVTPGLSGEVRDLLGPAVSRPGVIFAPRGL